MWRFSTISLKLQASSSAIDEVGAASPGSDKFTPLNKMDWRVQLEVAMKLGLGTVDYELIKM